MNAPHPSKFLNPKNPNGLPVPRAWTQKPIGCCPSITTNCYCREPVQAILACVYGGDQRANASHLALSEALRDWRYPTRTTMADTESLPPSQPVSATNTTQARIPFGGGGSSLATCTNKLGSCLITVLPPLPLVGRYVGF